MGDKQNSVTAKVEPPKDEITPRLKLAKILYDYKDEKIDYIRTSEAIEALIKLQQEALLNRAIATQLPWPKDIFGEVPDDDWPKLNEFAKKELGYPIDRISGDLMRHGWNCYLLELNKLRLEL